MVARSDGRAGGGGSARQRGGHQAQGGSDVPPLQPRAALRRRARRPPQADRDRLEQAARALLTTDGWQRWIRVRATNGLSRYSVGNQMLIAIEAHARGFAPTYVAGFRGFLDLNRCVRKGEKAIRMLAPVTVKQRDERGDETGEKKVFFRTVSVFDTLSRDCRCCRTRSLRTAMADTARVVLAERVVARAPTVPTAMLGDLVDRAWI